MKSVWFFIPTSSWHHPTSKVHNDGAWHLQEDGSPNWSWCWNWEMPLTSAHGVHGSSAWKIWCMFGCSGGKNPITSQGGCWTMIDMSYLGDVCFIQRNTTCSGERFTTSRRLFYWTCFFLNQAWPKRVSRIMLSLEHETYLWVASQVSDYCNGHIWVLQYHIFFLDVKT